MKFYLSHPIRGKYGKDATHEQMKANCDKAVLIANMIRNAIPSVEIYCPAEHEDFVGLAYAKHILTEEQILDIDCSIIDGCEGVLLYTPEDDTVQGGREVERDYAISHHKTVQAFNDIEDIINRIAQHVLRT